MKSTVMRQTVKMKPRYALLYEMGELTKAELDQLIQEWRHEFDRANKPNFFSVAWPCKILEGEEARCRHCKWAGIPDEILKQFESEHKALAPGNELGC
jgi:hypothetical protein